MAAAAIPYFDSSYFFHQLARVQGGVLVLDYDAAAGCFNGPQRFPFPTLHELLDAILHTTRTRLVLISKHSGQELASRLGLRPNPEIRETLNQNTLAQFGDAGPLVYVTALGARVLPQFFLEGQSWMGAPEDLVQFLVDWLRACGGEAC